MKLAQTELRKIIRNIIKESSQPGQEEFSKYKNEIVNFLNQEVLNNLNENSLNQIGSLITSLFENKDIFYRLLHDHYKKNNLYEELNSIYKNILNDNRETLEDDKKLFFEYLNDKFKFIKDNFDFEIKINKPKNLAHNNKDIKLISYGYKFSHMSDPKLFFKLQTEYGESEEASESDMMNIDTIQKPNKISIKQYNNEFAEDLLLAVIEKFYENLNESHKRHKFKAIKI